MRTLLYKLWPNIRAVFRGRNLAYLSIGIALTILIASSDFDWWWFTHTRGVTLNEILLPAIVIGAFLPILGPFCILAVGIVWNKRSTIDTAYAIAQAQGIGLLISSTAKALTGRIPPSLLDTTKDISTHFQFGLLRGGVFWGWPSTHTTIAFAMAATVSHLYPNKTWLKILVFGYACYVGLGVSISIHWFSDFVAGIFLGCVIGNVVGRTFALRQSVERHW